jgi:hypothetical protein
VSKKQPLQSLFLIDVLRDPDSRPVLLYGFGTLLLGALVYHWLEGWSFLDAFYFCVISLATIGYGDLAPTTPVARAFTIFYVINGIVILLSLLDRIREVRKPRFEEQDPNRGRSD